MLSAVGCALIQQWCYEYLKFAYPRGALHECGRVRTYLFQGLNVFRMRRFMYGIHVLLHILFFLFFFAISDFFYTVNHHFGNVTRGAFVASIILYTLLSIFPLIFSNSPYNTPITPSLRAGTIILRIIIRFPLWCLRRIRGQPFELIGLPYYKGILFRKTQFFSTEAETRAEMLEPYAMKWLFTKDDFTDKDMDKFLEGLPGYISSAHTKTGQLDRYLTANHILRRIKHHFMTCATSVELSDERIIDRVSLSVEALRLIFQQSLKPKQGSSVPDKLEEKLQLQQAYIQGLIDDFQTLCGVDNPTMALRASCVRGLVVLGLLSRLVQSDESERGTIPSRQFPVSLIPLYKFFFPNDSTDIAQRLSDGDAPSSLENAKMWKSFLQDGPLANLTILAQDILYRKRAVLAGEQPVFTREQAPSSTLSFCWTTLDILLMQLGTIHSEGLTRAQSEFDHLRMKTHMYVHARERGFRVTQLTPLLEILDIVARGRRLLMVFSDHLEYHSRTDIVFGREYLQNSDLLQAFAYCLPEFIATNPPEVGRRFMEDIVNRDGLWTSLLIGLSITERSDSPLSYSLRVFENCCTVLDATLSALEDSQKVDWRAPELGLLLQHFELFIPRCSRSAFIGRAISFRVDNIKAQICKALLAHFKGDIDRDGTESIRSEWDIPSLARLISTFGLRGKEAKFWNSYVNGAKTPDMANITARDGPLLIFCQLVHLVTTSVPLDQCRLELEDIEKLWVLQRKLIEDQRLPLYLASDTVWEELGRLRGQVKDLCGKNVGEDAEILQRLLGVIDDVSNLRVSGSKDPSKGESTDEQNIKVLSNANLTSSRGMSDQFSFASESSTAIGGLSSGAQTSEGEDVFTGASSLFFSRDSIDSQAEGSTHKFLDSEKMSHVRPVFPQGYEAGFYGAPSPWIMDRTSGIFRPAISPAIPYSPYMMADARQIAPSPWTMDQPIGSPAIPPVYPYFPHTVDASQRLCYTYTRGTSSGFSGTRPNLSIQAPTGTMLRSRRGVLGAVPSPRISPTFGFFDVGDQSGISPVFEQE